MCVGGGQKIQLVNGWLTEQEHHVHVQFQSGSESLKMWNKWMTGFRNMGFQLQKDANCTCWLNVGFRVFSFANEYPHNSTRLMEIQMFLFGACKRPSER